MEIPISPLRSGTIIKIYNSNRGQDYVLLGKSKAQNKIVMVKNSAITNEGKLFKQTKLYFLDMESMFQTTDPFYFVPKVKRVVGHRSFVDVKKETLSALLSSSGSFYTKQSMEDLIKIINSFETLRLKDEVYPPIDTPDINKVVKY